jgi:hypothetical protein
VTTTGRTTTITLTIQAASYAVLALVAVVGALVVLGTAYLPPAIDWHRHFVPAARQLAQGASPYAGTGVHNPPWVMAMLVPFAANEAAGRAALFLIALVVYAWTAYRFEAGPGSLALFLVSPLILHTLLLGNLEWLVFIGLLLPPRWGLFLVLAKPQMGAGVALVWAWTAWREAGWREAVRLCWPVTAATLASFALYGLWPLTAGEVVGVYWNATVWPWLVPVGTVLMTLALRRRSVRLALVATPLLSPYVAQHAWAGALLASVHRPKWHGLIVLVLWMLVAVSIVIT